jgi:hypothetical protein
VAFTCFLVFQISSCCYNSRNRGSPEPPGSSPFAASTPQSPGSEERTVLNTNAVGLFEGSLEVKLPTIWTDEKQRWEESERREE